MQQSPSLPNWATALRKLGRCGGARIPCSLFGLIVTGIVGVQEAAGGATPSPTVRRGVLRFAGPPPNSADCCSPGGEENGTRELACAQLPAAAPNAAQQERMAAIEAQIARLTEVHLVPLSLHCTQQSQFQRGKPWCQ